jgi:hypothetical protein
VRRTTSEAGAHLLVLVGGRTQVYCHYGVKKAHDWMVDQLADLFLTTHKVKTQ